MNLYYSMKYSLSSLGSGCWGSDFSHFYRMVGLLARHGERVGWERMISHEYRLDDMNAALEDVAAGRVVKAVVRPNG